MYIEQLDDARLLIALGSEETTLFGGSAEAEDCTEGSLRAFYGLISLAAAKTGIPLNNKRITVELLPGGGSCLMIVTFQPQKRLPAGRSVRLIAGFKSAGDMLECTSRLREIPEISSAAASIRKARSGYFVAASSAPLQARAIFRVMSEYAPVRRLSLRESLRLNEYSEQLYSGSISKLP